jgi:acetylornithine/succinyldiaminopimelate/putrescine aminotransferase
MSREQAHELWRRFVSPDFVDLLETFDFGRCFVRAEGNCLYDDAGREYTDFLAGFGVHNIGHNHPVLVRALQTALGSLQPSMLNVDAPALAGEVAERLTGLTHESLCRTAFGNSGAEVVDLALRAAWAATGRPDIIACHDAYHGLSVGSLSLMGQPQVRKEFALASDRVHHIPFNDLDVLEDACRRHRPAAFIVEPIQAEGGINCPDEHYLPRAAEMCRRWGTLLIVDEIQTGLGRTGRWFATDLARVQPDILLLGKALSGGIVPVSAAMMAADVWKRGFSGPRRRTFVSSTFAGNALAMTAALTTLSIIEAEHLCDCAGRLGERLKQSLETLRGKHKMIQDIRGEGLLVGIEFAAPSGFLAGMVPAWARDGLYAQVASLLLLRDHGLLTQPCSLNGRVLRLEPPLAVSQNDLDRLCPALNSVLEQRPSFRSAALSAFRRVVLRGEV